MVENKLEGTLGLRRLRQNPWVRELVREVRLDASQMIQPLFVVESGERQEVQGLPDVFRETPDSLLSTIEQDLQAGVRKFLLFGVPREKKVSGFSADFTAAQIEAIKKRFGRDLFLAVDVCLCSYTAHGHCGVLVESDHSGCYLDNATSVEALAQMALLYAQSGADCVAPSDMMDGRVGAIRKQLDAHGQLNTVLMSYSAKFHSKFYGPFRLAADSAPNSLGLSDRSTYQLDPARFNDAYLSSLRDSEEGADILMVKPGLPYLDILSKLSTAIPKPWAVYQVSGEYAGIELLARNGLMKGPEAHVEAWTSFVRAGASMIITYAARRAQQYLKESIS